MKSLIVGMGIGQLYKTVLTQLGHEVVTVDSNPAVGADYYDYTAAYIDHGHFDTVHICTPNFTHLNIARNVAGLNAKIVFVEKPGVENHTLWKQMVTDYPNTRFTMVKNNQYRAEIELFKEKASLSDHVYVRWNNANRIPNPGSWFTTKKLAFGGVSRDLLPHMLSYYCKLTNYKDGELISAVAKQNHQLKDITSTDYGVVNPDGTFDVDDFCLLEFRNGNTLWTLTANWKTNLDHNDSSIAFCSKNSSVRHELGLCPEEAYKEMIETAIVNLNNDEFWQNQLEQDLWIHERIENL